MKRARLASLSALTRGAAVVGLGVIGAAGCSRNDPPLPPTINAPPSPRTEAVDPSATPSASAPLFAHKFPTPNAVPLHWHLQDGGADDAGAPSK